MHLLNLIIKIFINEIFDKGCHNCLQYQRIRMLTIFTLAEVIISYLTILCCIQNVLGLFQNNKQMDAHVIFAMENIGQKMCLRECTRYKGCSGVNYRADTLTCQLLSVSLPGDTLNDSEGFSFSNLDNYTPVRF